MNHFIQHLRRAALATLGLTVLGATALAQVLHTLRQRDPGTFGAIAPTAAQLDDCGWVANRWCELLPVPLELKQQLMELENPLVRLELVGDVLERTGIAT